MKNKLACLLIVLAHTCLGQNTGNAWRMFVLTKSSMSVITGHLKNPILKEKASRLYGALLKYNPRQGAVQWEHIALAEEYLSQLNQDFTVLRTAADDPEIIDSYADKLGPALDDMYLKVNACLLNHGNAVGSVSVTVHTKKSGIEVSNWRVVCIAKILQLYPKFSPKAFPRLSSPTKWQLAPGRYIMWAEDPQTASKSSTQEIPIDRDQECDLAVP